MDQLHAAQSPENSRLGHSSHQAPGSGQGSGPRADELDKDTGFRNPRLPRGTQLPHPPPSMPDWLYGSILILSGIWVTETVLFLLTYRAFGRS